MDRHNLLWIMLRWLLPGLLFVLHQYTIAQNRSVSIAQSYLDDILVVPLCLGLLDFLNAHFALKMSSSWRYALALVGVLWFAIGFEIILPYYFNHGTSDPLDGLAYASGAMFYLWLFPEPETPKPNRA